MTITEQELEKMYNWINNSMRVDTWYPVKSEKAFDVIIQLFKEGLIDYCELNEDKTQIRKVDKNLLNNS